MKVLFPVITEPWTHFSSSVAALSAAVRSAGHDSAILAIPLASTVRDAAERIASEPADVIGVNAWTRDWEALAELLPMIKASRDVFTVVGGYHATLAAREVASCEGADAICIGEGDRALPALLDQLAGSRTALRVPGMWLRGPSGFAEPIPTGAPEPDIAALPPWDYEVFGDVAKLLELGINTFSPVKDRFLPARASRGCPFKCAYCSAPRWGTAAGFDAQGRRNVRPVEHLCSELGALRDRHRPDGFEFWDEHFPIELDWLRELAREYPARVGLPFRVEMHPNAATRPRIEALVAAGCVSLHVGVEAGDAEYRRRVLKRTATNVTLERVFADARELGLLVTAAVMMGSPGETAEQVQATLDLVRRLRPANVVWSAYTDLPGTELGERAPRPRLGNAERFDDFRKRPPAARMAMSESQAEQFRQGLSELKNELVASAGWQGAPSRAGTRSPLLSGARMTSRPSQRLLDLLGLHPPGGPASAGVRVNFAEWHFEGAVIEIESTELPPRVIVIRARDAGPSYAATDHLSVAYPGREAQDALQHTLDALVVRLAHVTLDEVRRAFRA